MADEPISSDASQLRANRIADHIDQAAEGLAAALALCCDLLPRPFLDGGGPRLRWNFHVKSREIAIVMIASKAVSSLHAATILWRFSHLQEAWALIRIIQDCDDDVFLLSTPIEATELTAIQQSKLDEFYYVGHVDLSQPLSGVPQKPALVPRDKIAAQIGRHLHEGTGQLDPHSATNAIKRLQAVHSGYVHSNFYRVAEMISGRLGGPFRVNVLGTPDPGQAGDLLTYLLSVAESGLLSVQWVVARLGSSDAQAAVQASLQILKMANELEAELRADARRPLPGQERSERTT